MKLVPKHSMPRRGYGKSLQRAEALIRHLHGGGKIVFIGTPSGENNFFEKFIKQRGNNMKTVWIVSQGETGEGSTVKGVFEGVKAARKRERELKNDEWFDDECDYVTVKEWLVNETI